MGMAVSKGYGLFDKNEFGIWSWVVSTLRKVGVLCSEEECLPHGYIDLFVYSEDKPRRQ